MTETRVKLYCPDNFVLGHKKNYENNTLNFISNFEKYVFSIRLHIKPGAPQGAALYDRRGRTLNSWGKYCMDTTFKLDIALNMDCD